MYYHLLRANYLGHDSEADPFPGTMGLTRIANFTNPSLKAWDGTFNEYFIDNIAEQDRLITFDIMPDTSILSVVEDFEAMPVSSNLSNKNVPGVFCNWDFSKSTIKEYEANGTLNQGVAMKKPSSLTTTAPLKIIPYMVSFSVYNPTSTEANVRLSYSVDNGENWIALPEGVLVAQPKNRTTTSLILPYDKPIMLRFNQTSGSDKANIFLDDVKLYYSETWPDPVVKGDVNGDGEVNIVDVNAIIDVILTGDAADKGFNADVNDDGEVNIADISAIIEIILSSN